MPQKRPRSGSDCCQVASSGYRTRQGQESARNLQAARDRYSKSLNRPIAAGGRSDRGMKPETAMHLKALHMEILKEAAKGYC